MKYLLKIASLSLLPLLLTACTTPKDLLQANTWVMYEHIHNDPTMAEEVKDKFSRADEKLVLYFAGEEVEWKEDGITQKSKYELLDESSLNMFGKTFHIKRLGDLGLILVGEQDGSLDQYQFAPEDCPCWEK